MSQYRNLQQLITALKNEAYKEAKNLDKYNKQVLEDKVEEIVYGAGNPITYQRTNQLKDASTSETTRTTNKIRVNVFTDTDMLSHDPSYPYANTFPSNSDFTDYLPITIEEGLSGDLFGEGFWRKKRPYMESTLKFLKQNYHKELKNNLKSAGIKTK